MYKLLLIWRYLLTRRIALVSVVSVTLGVATMIVVNAVMLGFSREMENRIHGALSDVTVSAYSLRGFDDVDARIRDAQKVAGDLIEAITPTVTTPGMLSFEFGGGEVITRQVQIVGIDAATNERVTAIAQYLQHPENRKALSFDLREGGYDVQNPTFGDDGVVRPRLAEAGWKKRRADAKYEKYRLDERRRRREILEKTAQADSAPPLEDVAEESVAPAVDPYAAALQNFPKAPTYDPMEEASSAAPSVPNAPTPFDAGFPELESPIAAAPSVPELAEVAPETPVVGAVDEAENVSPRVPTAVAATPFDGLTEFETEIDKETTQETGAILGVGLVSGARRRHLNPATGVEELRESLATVPGADVTLSFLGVNFENPTRAFVSDRFTVVDLYECRMAEYDESFVFVPIDRLQKLRGMIADDGTKMATQLLIKAKPGVKIEELRDRLRAAEEFPEQLFEIETWRDQQATTLAAVEMELSILNVLLFLSICVAGFGILAIFFMIVVEKTRDVGILKSLGASGNGIMQIFLLYGLALGVVGAGLGTALGFWFVANIQEIADFLSRMTGREVFDPSIYMFHQVPAIIEPATVFWIVVGSLFIAVASSVLPALRAARLKPVDALRI
ncbi:MAG: FtsX-like permease family protein [Thermoguttaceae bacterium]|nr:FtsX-like permease family protein [Thermoguttaceae bacterium]